MRAENADANYWDQGLTSIKWQIDKQLRGQNAKVNYGNKGFTSIKSERDSVM